MTTWDFKNLRGINVIMYRKPKSKRILNINKKALIGLMLSSILLGACTNNSKFTNVSNNSSTNQKVNISSTEENGSETSELSEQSVTSNNTDIEELTVVDSEETSEKSSNNPPIKRDKSEKTNSTKSTSTSEKSSTTSLESSNYSENTTTNKTIEKTEKTNKDNSTSIELSNEIYQSLVDTLFEPTRTLELATAGSSLKTAKLSATYLNYLAELGINAETFYKAFQKYYDSMRASHRTSFKFAWDAMDIMARALSNEDEWALLILKDTDYDLAANHLDKPSWVAFSTLVGNYLANN